MTEHRTYAYELKDVMHNNFDYAWDQKELWKIAENKRIITYNMNDVKHWIYNQCWSKKGCFISIFQVLNQPNKFAEHINRIKNADISYPLIIMEDPYDKYGSILDGSHRFAKMLLEKKRKINVVYFTKKELNKLKIKL